LAGRGEVAPFGVRRQVGAEECGRLGSIQTGDFRYEGGQMRIDRGSRRLETLGRRSYHRGCLGGIISVGAARSTASVPSRQVKIESSTRFLTQRTCRKESRTGRGQVDAWVIGRALRENSSDGEGRLGQDESWRRGQQFGT